MLQLLSQLRHKCAVGFVGGSDLVKQQEQLGTQSIPVTTLFDFCFAENGLTAYRMGKQLASTSFIGWLGEEKYKQLVNFCLVYVAGLDIPIKRGTFVEFRYVQWSESREGNDKRSMQDPGCRSSRGRNGSRSMTDTGASDAETV